MAEFVHKGEIEALKNATERHRTQMQGAWEEANVNAAIESVTQAHLLRKAQGTKAKKLTVEDWESAIQSGQDAPRQKKAR
jgi:hypothetical protein